MNAKSKHPPALTFEAQLKTVPLRNEGVRTSRDPSKPEALIVELDLTYRGALKLLTWFTKPRKTKKYELEGLALQLYERIDGHRSVEQFIDQLMAEQQLTFFEARALIAQYFKSLMERGLIVIAAP